MGFFDELKNVAKEGAANIKNTMKTEELKSQIRDLERKENEEYAEIGREVVALDGPEKFGEKGSRLMKLRSEIETKRNELAAIEGKAEPVAEEKQTEEQAKKFCPKCGTQAEEGTKFCGQCGAKLE